MGKTQLTGNLTNAISQDASNNVGIGGSPSGSYKLEVTGTAKVSSTLLLGGALSGTSATFSSSVTSNGNNIFNNSGGRAIDAISTGVLFAQNGGSHNIIFGDGNVRYFSLFTPSGAATMSIRNFSTSTDFLTFAASTGAATFSSSVTAANLILNGTTTTALDLTSGTFSYALDFQNNDFIRQKNVAGTLGLVFGMSTDDNLYVRGFSGINLQVNNGTTALALALTGAATFSSSVTATTGTLSTAYNGGGIGQLHITSSGTEGGTITFEKTSGTAQKYKFGLGVTSLFIYNETAGNQPFTLTSAGNILLNTTAVIGANSVLTILAGSTREGLVIKLASGAYSPIWIRNSSDVAMFYINEANTGYLNAAAWSYGSDRRIKENIINLEGSGLDTILKLNPVRFDYIDGVKNNIGWIAQDVQEVIPEAVGTISKDNDQLTLKSDYIVPYLVKAIQELSAQNQDLKSRLDKAGL